MQKAQAKSCLLIQSLITMPGKFVQIKNITFTQKSPNNAIWVLKVLGCYFLHSFLCVSGVNDTEQYTQLCDGSTVFCIHYVWVIPMVSAMQSSLANTSSNISKIFCKKPAVDWS